MKTPATHDFGTVVVTGGADRVSVRFPHDPDLARTLTAIRGKWAPQWRCWMVHARDSGLDANGVAERVRKRLEERAPAGWPEIARKLADLSAVTKAMELRVGIGGVRIRFPVGHPDEELMRAVPGARQDGRAWLVPAESGQTRELLKAMAVVAAEDRKKYDLETSWIDERTIAGPLVADDAEARRIGLAQGALVFADLSFVDRVDPRMVGPALREYPFRCAAVGAATEGVREARLAYLRPGDAYPTLRARTARGGGPALTLAHAGGTFRAGA